MSSTPHKKTTALSPFNFYFIWRAPVKQDSTVYLPELGLVCSYKSILPLRPPAKQQEWFDAPPLHASMIGTQMSWGVVVSSVRRISWIANAPLKYLWYLCMQERSARIIRYCTSRNVVCHLKCMFYFLLFYLISPVLWIFIGISVRS